MKKIKYILLLFLVISAAAFAADEIHIDYESGATVYACRFQELGGNVFVTDGSSDEVWATAGDYDVTMTENGTGGHFVGNFDTSANIGDGTYKITVYEQLGGSPADSDRAIYVGEIKWKDGAEDRNAAASDSATTDALITSSHSTTDGKIDTTDALITSSHSTTDALITSSHSTTDGKIDTTDALITSSHSTTDALITSSHSTTDGKIDTTDALITSSHSTTDVKIDTTDALITSSHSTTDALITTIDGNVDSILVLTTWAQNVMEADDWIDTAPTPWQLVTTVKDAGGGAGGAELIRKDLKTINDDDVTSSDQRIDRTVEP